MKDITGGWGTRMRLHSGFWTVAGLSAVLSVPMLVALVVMYQPRWLPLADTALVELRVRDVLTSHTPVVGQNGRFEAYGEIGSHPGPLAYYLLWPVYQLFGADGRGLMVSGATLTFVAVALAVWLAHRRGGWQAALGVTAALALVMRAYTAPTLAEPWNPYVPLIWWVTFLLAVWAVLDRDLVGLPVAVFAGSLAAQAHVSYALPVVAVLLSLVVAGGVLWWRQGRGAVPRPALAWIGGSLGLGLVLWALPLAEEVTHDPGNLSIMLESLRNPTADRVPFSLAIESWLIHLNPWALVSGGLSLVPRGSIVPGLVFLAVWAATVVMAVRRADWLVVRLHAVAGVAAVAALVATARITGPLWSYLVRWSWGTTALMVFAAVWTIWRALPADRQRFAAGVVAAAALVGVVLFTADARHAEMRDATLSRRLDRLTDATLEYLAGDPAGCGDRCRYLVTWDDYIHVGSEGNGLLVELERRGFDVGGPPHMAAMVRGHRVIHEQEAAAVIHVAVAEDAIDKAAEVPGSVQVGSFDIHSLHTPRQRAAHESLVDELVARLRAEGYDELVELAASGTGDLVPLDHDMSFKLKRLILKANKVHRPSAVFVRVVD